MSARAVGASKAARQRRIDELLTLSDIVIASREFARRYTGEARPEAAARKLFSAGRRFAAVTLGPAGAIGFDGSILLRCPAFAVGVVDTTGAGDAFCGALCAALAHGADHAQALAAGQEAGAKAVQHEGAQPDGAL